RGIHVITMALEQRFQRHQHRPLVVDDQDAMVLRFHYFALLVLRTCRGLQLLKLRECHEVQPCSDCRLEIGSAIVETSVAALGSYCACNSPPCASMIARMRLRPRP